MRFGSVCLCLCTLFASLVPPTLVQCSGPEVFTLRVLPGQQAVAIGDDQGRDLMESGRFSKYACTSLDGPDCGMVNGHSKLDIAQILASMLEMIGSSRKATVDDSDQDATASSTTTSASSASHSDTATSTSRKPAPTHAQQDEVDGSTSLTADQLSALQAALAKQLHELLGAHLSSDSYADTDSDTEGDGTARDGARDGEGDSDSEGSSDGDEHEPHIEMQIVDGEVDLSQVEQDGTSVHAFTIGADGETHAITPEELKQLLRAAQRMKNKLKGAGATGNDDSESELETRQQQQEHDQDDDATGTHARSARPTRMTPEQMRRAREQQQEADWEEPR